MKPYTIHFTLYTIILASAMMSLSSCNPEAKAVSGQKVKVTIEPQITSSGFMNVRFSTNTEAYYHIGILPVAEAPDLTNSTNAKSFMALMLDQAYADFLYWRSGLLMEGTPYVAEFASHSLQYGTVDHSFTLLTPDTDYLIYAFPVNVSANKPDGRLFLQRVSTSKTSAYEDMQFIYRVRGYWDYIYPTSSSGSVLADAPWGGATRDSLWLRELGEYASVHAYFSELFSAYQLFQANDLLHFGIYVHNNDGFGDGSSDTFFEEGHTYYTALALMDGYLSQKASAIYKFTWHGEQTQLLFDSSQRLTTDW